jgi:hypothetical protein
MILGMILFINLVSAIPQITINVDDKFYSGDEVKFTYLITSNAFEILKYVPNINCEGNPQALLNIEEIRLEPNKPFFGNYNYGKVEGVINSGRCTASISVLEPYNREFSKSFEIVAEPIFSLDLSLCKDAACNEKSKIFLKNEEIYFNYNSDVEELDVAGEIVYPDGSKKSIKIPSSIKASQIGTHDLEVIGSKKGYRGVTQNIQFAVIEQNANIQDVSVEDIDNNQEIVSRGAIGTISKYDSNTDEKSNNKIVYIILVIVGILLVLFIVILLIMLSKEKKSQESKI